jgi:hypothetical protein
MLTFRQAADTVIPFGKYRGSTIDSVAETDEGLRYLDWLYGERENRKSPIDEALRVYLSDQTIAAELSKAVARSGNQRHTEDDERTPTEREQRWLRDAPLRSQNHQRREGRR